MFSASLPDLNALDLEAVKALLIDRHESYTATLNSRTSEIERLVLLVEKLQRMLFGANRLPHQQDQRPAAMERHARKPSRTR